MQINFLVGLCILRMVGRGNGLNLDLLKATQLDIGVFYNGRTN